MSKSSQGHRSAKDVRHAHQTTGEPVWAGTDSSQLKTMSMIRTPDFVIQDELYMTEGVPDAELSTVLWPSNGLGVEPLFLGFFATAVFCGPECRIGCL